MLRLSHREAQQCQTMMHRLKNRPLVDLSEGFSILADLVRLQEVIGGGEMLLNISSRYISSISQTTSQTSLYLSSFAL